MSTDDFCRVLRLFLKSRSRKGSFEVQGVSRQVLFSNCGNFAEVTTTSVASTSKREAILTVVAFVTIFCMGVALALPEALCNWRFAPDAIGYIATAHNWLEGRGWVDPVLYSYFLPDSSPPISAFAIRPPVISMLLVLPIAMGASLTSLAVLHVFWASLIGAASLLVGKRVTTLATATAFALAITGSVAWTLLADQVLTEVTSVGLALLFLAFTKSGLSSVRGAIGLGLLLLVAYFTRPNLGILLPAAALAYFLEYGLKASLRSAPLWTFALTFAASKIVVSNLIEANTGVVPYAHYGLMAETVNDMPLALFNHDYEGGLVFLSKNWDLVGAAIRDNFLEWCSAFFDGVLFMRAGWLAVPAIALAVLRPGPQSLIVRTAAFAAIGFTLVALGVYGGFDVSRYPLQGFVFIQLLNVLLIARLAAHFRWSATVPLIVVTLLFVVDDGPLLLNRARNRWRDYQAVGTRQVISRWDRRALVVGEYLDRNAILASPNPWTFYKWWGMAGVSIPVDLTDLESLHRYLDEIHPGYLLTEGNPSEALLQSSKRLKALLVIEGTGALFEVLNPGKASRPWTAPSPLASLGDDANEP